MRNNYHDLPALISFNDPYVVVALFIILGVIFFLLLIFVIVKIIARWMLFEKTGQAGWKAIIPVYKNWIYTVDICKCHWAVFLVEEIILWGFLVTIIMLHGVGTLLLILIRMIKSYNLALKTHQSATSYIWFAFFGVPVDLILGFCRKSYEYDPNIPSSGFGFFGTKS